MPLSGSQKTSPFAALFAKRKPNSGDKYQPELGFEQV